MARPFVCETGLHIVAQLHMSAFNDGFASNPSRINNRQIRPQQLEIITDTCEESRGECSRAESSQKHSEEQQSPNEIGSFPYEGQNDESFDSITENVNTNLETRNIESRANDVGVQTHTDGRVNPMAKILSDAEGKTFGSDAKENAYQFRPISSSDAKFISPSL